MKILESFEEFNKKMTDYDEAYKNAKIIKDSIRKLIEELPDNPNINRLGGNAFTISTKDMDISKSLNPFYYDFKDQYELHIS